MDICVNVLQAHLPRYNLHTVVNLLFTLFVWFWIHEYSHIPTHNQDMEHLGPRV
jgi:hypothetical protein